MRIIARRTLRDFVESRAGHKDQPALKAALDAIATTHGSIEGYARTALGLDEAQIAAVRDQLLEP